MPNVFSKAASLPLKAFHTLLSYPFHKTKWNMCIKHVLTDSKLSPSTGTKSPTTRKKNPYRWLIVKVAVTPDCSLAPWGMGHKTGSALNEGSAVLFNPPAD